MVLAPLHNIHRARLPSILLLLILLTIVSTVATIIALMLSTSSNRDGIPIVRQKGGLTTPPSSPLSPPVIHHSQRVIKEPAPVDIPKPLAPLSPTSSAISEEPSSLDSEGFKLPSGSALAAQTSATAVAQQPLGKGKGRYRTKRPTLKEIKAFRAQEPKLVEVKEFKNSDNEARAATKQRLIFIGDVHGCLKEFDRLLRKVRFNRAKDQVVLVGDLVAKGPDSVGVIRRAMEINAWCVRGNHDDRVIRWREFLYYGPGRYLSQNELRNLERARGLPYADFKLAKPHYKIAKQLSEREFEFMKEFPAILVLPPPYQDWVVVHGGLDPSKPLSEQDSHDVMNMRNIDVNGPNSSRDKGLAWFELWSAKMKILTHEDSKTSSSPTSSSSSLPLYADLEDKDAGSTSNDDSDSRAVDKADIINRIHFSRVVYGHDAGRDLQIHGYTKGLDSRCVYGGKLTAFILPEERIVSVACPNYDDSGSGNTGKDRYYKNNNRSSGNYRWRGNIDNRNGGNNHNNGNGGGGRYIDFQKNQGYYGPLNRQSTQQSNNNSSSDSNNSVSNNESGGHYAKSKKKRTKKRGKSYTTTVAG